MCKKTSHLRTHSGQRLGFGQHCTNEKDGPHDELIVLTCEQAELKNTASPRNILRVDISALGESRVSAEEHKNRGVNVDPDCLDPLTLECTKSVSGLPPTKDHHSASKASSTVHQVALLLHKTVSQYSI